MGSPPGRATSANVPRATYLDTTFYKDSDCEKDRNKMIEKCAAKPEEKKLDERTRKTGLRRHIRQVTSKLDSVGQKAYGYKKNTPATNAWMDDHCDGMWVKPQFNSTKDYQKEIDTFKDDLNNLGLTVDAYLKDPGRMIKAGFEQLAGEAVQKLGYENVRNMMLKKFGADALLAAVPTKAGFAAKAAAMMKAGFSAAGYLSGAEKLAAALGTDHAKELLDGLKYLTGEAQERLGALQEVWKEKPDAVMAELMSANAEIDSCLRARKCNLVPYKANSKGNTSKGEGCCPGQTAHHIIPHSAAKDAGCTDYKYGDAPTICLEGQDNNFGSHGRAHTQLETTILHFNGVGQAPKPISYIDMREKALDAISGSTEQCNPDCLRKQLDDKYKNCKDLVAKSGKGGATPTGTGETSEQGY